MKDATDKELAAWWDDLRSTDPKKSYPAQWRLADAPPEKVIPFLRGRIGKAENIPSGIVDAAIAELGDDDFAVREKAMRRLESFGPAAETALRKAARHPSPEVSRRADGLLNRMGKPSGETLRTLRAIAVLERIGSAEARPLLEVIADGRKDAEETVEAELTLARMPVKRRGEPAASAVGVLKNS